MSSEKPQSGAAPVDWTVPREASEKFSLARAAIQLYFPFLTAAAFRLVPRWTPLVPTLAVDRNWRLYMNPEFVLKLEPPVLALLIAGHELQHVLLGHFDRMAEHRDKVLTINGREHSFTNTCNDLAINSSLRQFAAAGTKYRAEVSGKPGVLLAPEDLFYPEHFRDKAGKPFPNGLVSEGYAELLMQNSTQTCRPSGSGGASGKGAGCGQCGSGAGDNPQPWEDRSPTNQDKPDSGVSPEEADILRQHTAEAAKDQAEKHRGTVPGAMELWAEAHLTPPKVDWRKELRAALRTGINWVSGRTDYSYSKPNRRGVATCSKVVLPGMFSPEPKFIFEFDTSGSMSASDYDAVFSECKGVLQVCGFREIPVLAVDAQVYGVQMISKVEQIAMKGGGGTDMAVGVRAAIELGYKLIIIATDGVTGWSAPPPPDTRVIIVLTQPETEAYPTPDWARVVHAYDT